jgi:hypothetical protein
MSRPAANRALWLVLCAGAFSVVQAAPTQAHLAAQAKVKESEAKKSRSSKYQMARSKAPRLRTRRVTSSGPFDISKPGTRNITEVLVDAKNRKDRKHFQVVAQVQALPVPMDLAPLGAAFLLPPDNSHKFRPRAGVHVNR